jgi:hypothetical protein
VAAAPHLLNAIPVQWDFAYRAVTGVLISIGALSWGLAAIASARSSTVDRRPRAVGLIIATRMSCNLMGTPMSEPLFRHRPAQLASVDHGSSAPCAGRAPPGFRSAGDDTVRRLADRAAIPRGHILLIAEIWPNRLVNSRGA